MRQLGVATARYLATGPAARGAKPHCDRGSLRTEMDVLFAAGDRRNQVAPGAVVGRVGWVCRRPHACPVAFRKRGRASGFEC